MRVHGPWDFQQTSMVTAHLVVDDSALVRHALGLNPFSNIVDLAEIGKYSVIFAVFNANAPQL